MSLSPIWHACLMLLVSLSATKPTFMHVSYKFHGGTGKVVAGEDAHILSLPNKQEAKNEKERNTNIRDSTI